MTQTTKQKLVDELKESGINPQDWFTECQAVNLAMESVGIGEIALEWLTNEHDGWVQATYYSDKLGKTVFIDQNVDIEYDSLEEMADALIALNDEALKLEARITLK